MLRYMLIALCLSSASLMAMEPVNQGLPPLIPREVLFGNPVTSSPQISPDGRLLSYLAPVNGVSNLWIQTVGLDDAHPVSKDTNRGVYKYYWACNNRFLLYQQDRNGDENWHLYRVDVVTKETVDLTPFEKITIWDFVHSSNYPDDMLLMMNKENAHHFDVYQLNIMTGELTLRAKNPGNVVKWLVDKNLCVRGAVASDATTGGLTISLRATEEDAWHIAMTCDFKSEPSTRFFGFSNDGKKLYMKDNFDTDVACLVEYDCDSGVRTILAGDPVFDVETLIRGQDGKPIAVSIEKERCVWIALDEAFAPTLQAILAIDNGDLFISNISVDSRYWVIGFEHDNQSKKYYLFNQQEKTALFLFADRPALKNYQLATMEPIAFTARDGLRVHGYLTRLVGGDKNLPLILKVHGGPLMHDSWGLNAEAQWLANRGYACLQVNYRGSLGYGKAFTDGFSRNCGKMHDDLIDAVSWAIAQGIADPERVAIYGWSLGGYAALVGATFTPDVFRCAVDIVGISNLVSWLSSLPSYWSVWQKQFDLRYGHPEQDRELLISRSPLFKIDNIQIPIFIAQGANDCRVNQAEAEQMVEAMKAKDLSYEYLLFPDEGHSIVKPNNKLTLYAHAEKFFARHLGGRCEVIE